MSDEMRQIRQQNSGRCPMTEAWWAERKVEQAQEGMDCCCITCFAPTYAKLLLAEHARAVRVVKRVGKQDILKRFDHKTYEYAEGYLAACLDILAALQRGRE